MENLKDVVAVALTTRLAERILARPAKRKLDKGKRSPAGFGCIGDTDLGMAIDPHTKWREFPHSRFSLGPEIGLISFNSITAQESQVMHPLSALHENFGRPLDICASDCASFSTAFRL